MWAPSSDKLWYPGATKRELPASSWSGRSWGNKPLGIIDHFTAGCGDPYGTLAAGGIGVSFYVDGNGAVTQYVPLDHWIYHAYNASLYYVGIEHRGLPGTCDITVALLQSSAKLNAWILDVTDVPTQRSFGTAFTPGIKSHADGLEHGASASWDPNGHWDCIWKCDMSWVTGSLKTALDRSPWTAGQYLAAVNAARAGVVPPKEKSWMEEFSADELKALHTLAQSNLAPDAEVAAGMARGLRKGNKKQALDPKADGPYVQVGKAAFEAFAETKTP